MNPLMALSCVRHGWSVIPLKPRGKRPYFPLLPIKEDTGRTWQPYQARLPTEDEVMTWWELCPAANIGIVTGEISGIVALTSTAQKLPSAAKSQPRLSA